MSSEPVYSKVFYGLQLSGLGGMAIILLTSIVERRHPIFLNFGFAWLLFCTAYVLLVGKPVDYQPSHQLCFTQAVLIYTVPILTAGTTLALVIYVLITLKSILHFSSTMVDAYPKILTPILVLAPYIPAAGLATLAIVIGSRNPEIISREKDVVYCNMKDKTPGKVSAVAVAVTMIGCLVLEIVICVDLTRHWLALRNYSQSKSMTIRVLLFTLFGIFAIVIDLVFFFTDYHDAKQNIVLALVPVTAVLVFGTQSDMLESWKRWIFCLPRKHQTTLSIARSAQRSSAYLTRSGLEGGGQEFTYPPESSR